MTDTEQKEICRIANIDDIGDLSDGYHTFNQLYYQRMILFATIVKQNKDKAWKSLRHSDGELCFGGGWFIVGIDTPEGSYTYHYEDNYFSLFDCIELERGKHWDGHTEKDVIRLLSLQQEPCDDCVSRQTALDALENIGSLDTEADKEYARSVFEALPSVTPQPEIGHWIEHEIEDTCKWLTCSVCGYEWINKKENFCPNCGRKMQEVK